MAKFIYVCTVLPCDGEITVTLAGIKINNECSTGTVGELGGS